MAKKNKEQNEKTQEDIATVFSAAGGALSGAAAALHPGASAGPAPASASVSPWLVGGAAAAVLGAAYLFTR